MNPLAKVCPTQEEELYRTHLKIVFRGEFNGTPEEWSFSTKWTREVTAGPNAGVADISDSAVNTALTTFINNARFQSSVWCTSWRAYVIGTDGRMEGNPKIVEFAPGAEIKGLSSTRFPTDQALCITTAGVNRGRARYGRFYLPGPSTALGTDHRLSTSAVNTWVTDTTTFLKAVSGAIDLPGTLESSEMVNISNDATGTSQTVDKIRVGKVYDRIERRRRQMVEDYVENATTIDW
jgi:hypothetical protein